MPQTLQHHLRRKCDDMQNYPMTWSRTCRGESVVHLHREIQSSRLTVQEKEKTSHISLGGINMADTQETESTLTVPATDSPLARKSTSSM